VKQLFLFKSKANIGGRNAGWPGKNQQLWDLGLSAQDMEDISLVTQKAGLTQGTLTNTWQEDTPV
jgi:hypothetical protein